MRYILIISFLFNVAFAQSLFGVVASDGNKLILDRVTVSSTHAYSFRKLRTAYTGNCVRVRRSSDNTQQDIGFVANYLDTAALKSFVGSNNGFVVTWYDQSGNSRNLTQSTTSVQPRIVNAGAIEYRNSRVSIYTSGSTGLTCATGIIGSTYSVSYVTASGSSSGYKRLINVSNADQIGFHGSLNGNMANFVGNLSAWNDVLANTPTFSLGSSNVLNVLFANMEQGSSALTPYANGTALNTKSGTTTPGTGFDLAWPTVVANQGQAWVGYTSEVIFFSTILQSTDRSTLFANQGSHFSVTIN